MAKIKTQIKKTRFRKREKSKIFFNGRLKNKIQGEIEKAKDLKELNEIFDKYLGKRGQISQILKSLKNLPKEKKARIGKETNELKKLLQGKIEQKKSDFALQIKKDKEEWFDITVPGKKPNLGHLNPLTYVKRKVEEIFQSMGFSVIEGPEIENEWYNFDALNIPKEHPARDMWDTLWLKDEKEKLLLRTHTSPVQVRYMEKNNPPLRIVAPGNVYRHEATDPSHEFQLLQLEGLMIGENVSVANFKAIIQEFLIRFFNKDVKIRLRPDFFPFTEPSFDVSMSCFICEGKGCQVCKSTGWLEVAGAGMVHPNVLKNSGILPKKYNSSGWQGWAFGFGLDRLAMMKYKINDIRLFRSGDLRFLIQF